MIIQPLLNMFLSPLFANCAKTQVSLYKTVISWKIITI